MHQKDKDIVASAHKHGTESLFGWPRSFLWLGVAGEQLWQPCPPPHPCSRGAGRPSSPSFRAWGWTAVYSTGTQEEFAPQLPFPMKLSAITSVYSKVPLPPCCLLFLPAAGGHLESWYPLLMVKSSFSIAPGCLTLQEEPLPGLIFGFSCA